MNITNTKMNMRTEHFEGICGLESPILLASGAHTHFS
jgi:hypothetical protein